MTQSSVPATVGSGLSKVSMSLAGGTAGDRLTTNTVMPVDQP